MDQLILQLGDRLGRMAELARSCGDTLTVGRSFSNDVVITDAYVDPEQLTFYRSGGVWKVKVMRPTNPALINGQAIDEHGTEVSSGDRITVGRTHLHIYDSDYAVEPTHKLLLSSRFGHGQSHPLFALLMVIFVCAVAVFADYQELTTEFKWKDMLSTALGMTLVILFWAGAWALTGRLLRHQTNFTAQLGFTSLVIAVFSILTPLAGYVEYAANSALLGEITLWLIILGFLAALFRANLSFATNLRHCTIVAVISAGAILFATFAMLEFNQEEFSTDPEFSTVLKPPFTHLSGNRDVAVYLDAFEAEFDAVDVLVERD